MIMKRRINGKITKVLNGHKNRVNSLTVLQDGTLASGSSVTTIRSWDTKTDQSSKICSQFRIFISLNFEKEFFK